MIQNHALTWNVIFWLKKTFFPYFLDINLGTEMSFVETEMI